MAFSPSNKTTINSFPFFKLYYKHELIIMQSKRFCDFFSNLSLHSIAMSANPATPATQPTNVSNMFMAAPQPTIVIQQSEKKR